MISNSIRYTKGALLLSAILASSLILAGCGSDNDGSGTSMSDVVDPATDPNDMSDLGRWAEVSEGGIVVGYEHSGHNLMARFDAGGGNPTITPSSPAHQPTVSGTWSGAWIARYSDDDHLDA